ncbi:threonine-rich protein-like [Musca vetustissima]|uniref:threonine-rich protein-like n=1 Tax=Musca vetustissima TaxID=27455 RepID=UPI002AB6D703|nr:threonine-rich protein-like [Musca vetustissima]
MKTIAFLLVAICLAATVAYSRALSPPYPYFHNNYSYRPGFPAHHHHHHGGPVCGVLNGYFRTFSSLQEFLDTVKNGYGYKFHCNGPCPSVKPEGGCPRIYDPVCATNLLTTKTFSNPCVLAQESSSTGITWIQIAKGPCPVVSPPTVGPPVTEPPTPAADTSSPQPTTTEVTTPEPTTTEVTTEEPTSTEPATTPETTEATTDDTTTEEATTTTEAEATTTEEEEEEDTTTEEATQAPDDLEISTTPEVSCKPSTPSPLSLFAQWFDLVQSSPVNGAPTISFRNNVNNKYGIYAERNVYNNPCYRRGQC